MTARAGIGLVYGVGAALLAAVAVWAGQDANWDLQNYHLYSAYALLHWRYPLDVGAGAFQGYFNPLPYLPQYLLRAGLPPPLAAVLLAAVQAAVVPVAWAVTAQLPGLTGRPSLRVVAVGVGCTSAMLIGEVGTSFADLLLAPLVLGGLLAALRADADRPRSWAWAGLLVGLATGLKLTNGIYAAGLAVAVAASWRGWGKLGRAAAWVSAGFLGGVMATGGVWAGYLWVQLGNPVFPVMNTWFRSSSAAASDFGDPQFLPASLWDAVCYPLWIAWGAHPTSEAAFADPRLLLALPASAVAWWVGRRTVGWAVGRAGAFLWGSTLAWLGVFAIERYAVAIEVLAGIILVQSVANLSGRWRGVGCAVTAALVLGVTRPPDFWHRRWADNYLATPPAPLREPAAFLMVWHPEGYWAAALPAASRFYSIVPTGLATGGVLRDRLVQGLADAPGGRVWTLGPDFPMGEAVRAQMAALGYAPTGPCVRAPSLWWVDTVFCRAAPAGPRRLAAADLLPDEPVDFSRDGAGWIYEVSGWLEAGARGVAAVGPVARLAMHIAPTEGARVLALAMEGDAPLRINGVPAGHGAAVCMGDDADLDLVFGDQDGPALKLLLRTMRLREARAGECPPR